MCTWQIITSLNSGHYLSPYRCSRASIKTPCCTLRFQEIPIEPLELQSKSDVASSFKREDRPKDSVHGVRDAKGGRDDDKGISGIRVPRQRYIPVSKSELLDAILTTFQSQEDADEFLRFSSCLDSILHAEHKGILEEMRIDYTLTHSIESRHASVNGHSTCSEEEIVANGKHSDTPRDNTFGFGNMETNGEDTNKPLPFNYVPDLSFLLGSPVPTVKRNSIRDSRVAVATRFQRAFMKLLHDAQFEELSARDLMLTSSLNTDYLLTLPIYVDWKRASESNAIIFRRGYATERQKGLLIVEKLDYLQSKLLQGIFVILSKPLGKIGMWINEALKSASQTQEIQVWTKRLKLWFTEPYFSQRSYSCDERTFDNQLEVDQLSDIDLPIWLAAQKAVPRYEGLLSSVGPRERLLRKLLAWIGLIPSTPESSIDINSDSTACEPYLRPISLSRITLSDIWRPAMREACGNDLWKMLKTAVSILFSQSILQVSLDYIITFAFLF
ncbi:hypothetical protein HHK36_027335 [Tetracentron sinense]|uniref:Uncharacterized protein n=1 Tax=Tetracentron sinense TaxID=13715 RepID=A0A835D1H2_TETSI|nr:hypothetical protein HHK36_027335 [Tetracentron sinense]